MHTEVSILHVFACTACRHCMSMPLCANQTNAVIVEGVMRECSALAKPSMMPLRASEPRSTSRSSRRVPQRPRPTPRRRRRSCRQPGERESCGGKGVKGRSQWSEGGGVVASPGDPLGAPGALRA